MKRVIIGPRLFADLLVGRVDIQNLPHDIKVRYAHFDPRYDAFVVIIEHPSFSEVLEGDEVPVLYLYISPKEPLSA